MVTSRVLPWCSVFVLACVLSAQDAAELVAQGRSACERKEWDAAIALLDRALAQKPDDVEALRWRGHAYTGSNRPEKAFDDLARALELGGDDAWTYYAHAMALHHLGRLEAAVRGYTQALAIDASFAKAYEWRGFTLSRLGRHRTALVDLDVAMRLHPGNPWLALIRGKARACLLDVAGAEEDLWLAVDGDPTHADAAAQLGYLLLATGQRAPAVAQLQRALQLDAAGQSEVRPWLWHAQTAAGERDAAIASLAPLRLDAAPAWPRAVATFLAGASTSEALLAAVAEGAPDERVARRCAAWLHIGLVAQAGGREADALAAFARAVATDARDQWEWLWAFRALREVAGER